MVLVGDADFRPGLLDQLDGPCRVAAEGRAVDLLGPADVIDRHLQRVVGVLEVRVRKRVGGRTAHEQGCSSGAAEEGGAGLHVSACRLWLNSARANNMLEFTQSIFDQERDPMSQTIFTNANLVLDGFDDLQRSFEVLVEDGTVRALSNMPLERPQGANIIDVGGRTLMPGLIDAHAHIMGLSLTPKNIASPASEIAIASEHYLRNCLMDGFTTIREAGGADHATAHMLATGAIEGPRLFYSGKALTQTGGGADFRTPDENLDPCGHVGPFSNMSVIADGVDEVRKAAREELRKGASQIKLFASGGVVFPAEGHSTRYEFSEAEIAAVVEEATARNTYVMAHVYTDEGVRRCLKAGVRSIEHANFVSEETVQMMADAGAFLVPTFISLQQRVESAAHTHLPEAIVRNIEHTIERGRQVYAWARKHKVSIGLGTDLWGPDAQKSQLREFEMRMTLDTPANILRSATVTNADLLMSKGLLGTIAEGAHADLLIVDGDPLTDLRVLLDPQKNLKFIMKGGVVCKNEMH
ncbi:MAG: amidohydrolase family protein [Variovorax sp.]